MSAEKKSVVCKIKEFFAKKPVKYTCIALLVVSAAGLLIGGTATGTITEIISYVAEIISKLM